MGQNISGIVTNNIFSNDINEVQNQFGIKLEFIEEITFEIASNNQKEEDVCDVYFGKNGTILFLNYDLCIEPWSINNGKTLTFSLNAISMTFSFYYCENRILLRSFIDMNGEKIEDVGEKLDIELKTNNASTIIWKQIELLLETEFKNIRLNEKAYRYKLVSLQKEAIDTVTYNNTEKKQVKNKFKLNSKNDSININFINNDAQELKKAEALFNILVSEDDFVVKESLENISEKEINNFSITYIVNLSCFHRDSKVRKAAKNQLEKYAPLDLLIQLNENWKESFLRNQEYYHKKLFEHKFIDAAEFLIFSQVIRKNYYLIKPKIGLNTYASSFYNDEIENVFEVYQVKLEKISDKICLFQYITVACFSKQPKLDILDTIKKLSYLPNLHTLHISDSGLTVLPIIINKLSQLKTLVIDRNPIMEFPNDIVFLNIEKLNIKETKIKIINIEQFPNLKELWIDGKKHLDSIVFQNVTKEFKATSGRFFSEIFPIQNIQPKIEKKSKWKFW